MNQDEEEHIWGYGDLFCGISDKGRNCFGLANGTIDASSGN
jgi:hypothetical protein